MGEPQQIEPAVADLRRRIERRREDAHVDDRLAADREDTRRLIDHLTRVGEEQWRRLIPRRFWAATVADLDGAAATVADEWVAGGMGRNVLLIGNTGVGKTHAAIALARAAWDAGHGIRYARTARLLAGLRPGGGLRWRPDLVDVLVLDDLGTENPSGWTGEVLDDLIDARWRSARPTIVASNLTPEALAAHVGDRMWSRLYDDAIRQKLTGSDRRIEATC